MRSRVIKPWTGASREASRLWQQQARLTIRCPSRKQKECPRRSGFSLRACPPWSKDLPQGPISVRVPHLTTAPSGHFRGHSFNQNNHHLNGVYKRIRKLVQTRREREEGLGPCSSVQVKSLGEGVWCTMMTVTAGCSRFAVIRAERTGLDLQRKQNVQGDSAVHSGA